MNRPVVVAEVGINHNGDVGLAQANVGLARGLGADYVKFQKRNVEKVYARMDLDRPRVSSWGKTNREQKLGLEFGREEYDKIDEFCKAIGIKWFATPMEPDSLAFLCDYDPPFIKVASFDVTNMELLEAIRATGKPVIMSTGMSTKEQIDRAIGVLGHQLEYLLHCVSSYPTPDEDVNLSGMLALREVYGERGKIGYSNHSERIIYCVAATVLGAEMLEFHVTVDRNLYGSDQKASVGPTGFKRIMDHLASLERGWGDGSVEPRPSEEPAKKKLRRFP